MKIAHARDILVCPSPLLHTHTLHHVRLGMLSGNNRAATLITPRGELLLQTDAEGFTDKVRGDAVLLRFCAPDAGASLQECSLVDVTGQDYEDSFGIYAEIRFPKQNVVASWVVPNTPEGLIENKKLANMVFSCMDRARGLAQSSLAATS